MLTLLLAAPNRIFAVAVVVGLFAFEMDRGRVFSFIDQIEIQAGLDADERGTVLSATSVMGMSGAVLAAWLGTRFGCSWPITICLALNVVAVTELAVCESNFGYAALNFLWAVAYNFLVPYLLGALASLDYRGRCAVAGESLWNGGDAPGPWIAALLVQEGGMLSLAVWSVATRGTCLVLVTGALRRFESKSGEFD